MPLTKPQADRALAMWNANIGAASIGAEFRVSRNAIMGYVHRWRKAGLVDPHRGRPPVIEAPAPEIRPAPQPAPTPIAAPIEAEPAAPEPVAAPPMTTPDPKPVRERARPPVFGAGPAVLALRANDCRWPFSDAGEADFRFCCAPVRPGPAGQPPYCATHLRKALSGARALAKFGIEP